MNISTTLKKIEKALDLRFEKDSALYISKEDTEKIKKALYKSQFQNINGFIKEFGNKIVAKIILKYNWLIDFDRNKKKLEKIFNSVDKNFLKEIAKDIVKNRIYSTLEFREFIEKYYLETEPLKECEKIYKNRNKKIENRILCFKRYLEEEYLKDNPINFVVRFIDNEFNDYPEIYQFLQAKKTNFLISIFKNCSDSDKEKIFQWIIENKITNRKDKVWYNLFLSDKKIALEKSMEYIVNNPNWDNSIFKFLIYKVLIKFRDVDSFKEKIVRLYESHYLRVALINILEPTKFKNKELANSILDEFEKFGIPDKSIYMVETIREWDYEDLTEGFTDADKIIEIIESYNHDFNNPKTLDYFNFILNKTDKNIIVGAYYNNNNEKLKIIVSYHLAKHLERRKIPQEFDDILNDDEYVDRITFFIEKNHIKTKYAMNFLEENDKLELLMKFKRM